MGGIATRCPCCGSNVAADRPVVDLNSNTVAFGSNTAKARPKVIEFMSVLVEAWPHPVGTDALIAKVWGMAEPEAIGAGLKLLAWEARRATNGWPLTFQSTPGGYAMRMCD